MEKTYDPHAVEEKIYRMWEAGGYFTPKRDPNKQPFTIILPPPNANADLHLGHAMYVIEDIMIRYHRMKGDSTLWLPGADHAGFETQYVYEKHLAAQGKSRFDFDRETLYRNIWNFVHENRGKMEHQLRRLGFSLDWSRNVFTLDPAVVAIVYKTFKKLYDDGLVYRDARLVNYCTTCGTGFSDLEVKHVEQTDPLYYMKYGPFVLATVRPETKFGDTAVAVHPKDERYKKWIGREIEVEGLLGVVRMKVIADEAIDPSFGTGVAKVTPAHDMTDFDIGKRHNLPMTQVIGFDGRLTDLAGPYRGMKVKEARVAVAAALREKGLIDHVEESYTHTVATCYKCGTVLEPLPLPQWYVRVAPLADGAIRALKQKRVTVVPKRFEKHMLQWLANFHDWNISRQIVWGIRIPAWHCNRCAQAQSEKANAWIVTDGKKPDGCPTCGNTDVQQDPDTFDTWFSSAQWPYAALLSQSGISHFTFPISNGNKRQFRDFSYFYPTSVMETAYDILPWWVCRMLMLGLYMTGNVPFKTVYYHGLVRDAKGAKMSKSKGNVINPLTMVDRYGADAIRMALVYGTAAGNDQSLSEDKIRGMRNFANKLWNIARFISIAQPDVPSYNESMHKKLTHPDDKRIISELNMLVAGVTKNMDQYRFSDAAQRIYDFTWHTLADVHLEKNKERVREGDAHAIAVLRHVFLTIVKLAHPFMPFVTEAIWEKLQRKPADPLLISPWPR